MQINRENNWISKLREENKNIYSFQWFYSDKSHNVGELLKECEKFLRYHMGEPKTESNFIIKNRIKKEDNLETIFFSTNSHFEIMISKGRSEENNLNTIYKKLEIYVDKNKEPIGNKDFPPIKVRMYQTLKHQLDEIGKSYKN